jgi:hypothetical protein
MHFRADFRGKELSIRHHIFLCGFGFFLLSNEFTHIENQLLELHYEFKKFEINSFSQKEVINITGSMTFMCGSGNGNTAADPCESGSDTLL